MQVLEAEVGIYQRHSCPMCHGLGWVVVDKLEADGIWWYVTATCPFCGREVGA